MVVHWGQVSSTHWSLASAWSSLFQFRTDTSDLILLSLTRIAVVSSLSFLASRFAYNEGNLQGLAGKTPAQIKKVKSKLEASAEVSKSGKKALGTAELLQPLLDDPAPGQWSEEQKREKVVKDFKEKMEDTKFTEWFTSVSGKDLVIFISFLLCTGFQVQKVTPVTPTWTSQYLHLSPSSSVTPIHAPRKK